jgi:hypothetical protein
VPPRRRTDLAVLLASVLCGFAAASADARLYDDTSPFNQAIGANPAIDPSSGPMVQTLVDSFVARSFVIAHKEFTVPVYFADASTPRYDVTTMGQPPGAHYDPNFVHDVKRVMRSVPIPDDARPDRQIDGHMTIIDNATGCEYDFYAASKSRNKWSALWGNRISTHSDGVYDKGLSSRAVGFTPLSGMIWPDELRAGRIDHALVFAYPTTRKGGPVAPGTASDGKTDRPDAIPQGARVQLDPSLDLTTLGLTRHEMIVAKALQEYGMILGDTGGALSLYAVGAQSFPGNVYQGLLPAGTYVYMKKIPVDRFRVLTTGPQIPVTPLEVLADPCAQYDVVG